MDGQINVQMITVGIGIGNDIDFVVVFKRRKDGWTDIYFPEDFMRVSIVTALWMCSGVATLFWIRMTQQSTWT